MERRLVAVLIGDVVGYSRLSQLDEEGTHARFQYDLHEIFEPKISEHRGRLVKTMGDGLLVEFQSVVDAIRCAIDVQRTKAERNVGVPAHERFVYRIGINLGDVIIEGDDIHGDGVNIADRLQGLADPGGIAISGTAYDQVRTRLPVGYADLGEQRVKSIAEPVRVYRVMLDPREAGKTISKQLPPAPIKSWRWPAAAAAALALAIAAGGVAWWRPWQPRIEAPSVERMALSLPDKPSIAVLPFANMSDDPKQEYFADGITDDLITELSKVSGLFVISRNSTFVYKGKSVPLKQVAEELGVRFVVEGSVQRAGEQLRINAQLIDALSGGHEWADRFDGSLVNVFALQDEVTHSIADALSVRLTDAEQTALGGQETSVPAAYEAFLQGWLHYRRTTPEYYARAIPYLEEAIKLDPNYGRAYAALAMVYVRSYSRSYAYALGISNLQAYRKAKAYLAKAREHPTAVSHQVAGYFLLDTHQHSSAIAEFQESIALDPSDSWSYIFTGLALTSAGRPDEATTYISTAMRLDPHYPAIFPYYLGLAQFGLEQFGDAAASLESATKLNPDDSFSYLLLGATYGHMGQTLDAASAIARHNNIRVSRGYIPVSIYDAPHLGFAMPADRNRLRDGLRLAGVPDNLFQGEFAKRNRLTADEIQKSTLGQHLHGRTLDSGREHAATITTDGIITMSGDWGSGDATISRFDNDQLCFKWSTSAFEDCVTLFRNPGGTKASENEFIWLSARGAFTFSQVK